MNATPYATTDLPTTDLPCPDWCTLPTGHGFCSVTNADTFLRYHEHSLLGERWTSAQQDRGVTLHVSIDMSDSENAATEAGPIIETTAPLVYVEVSSGMTGPQTPRARRPAARRGRPVGPGDLVSPRPSPST